MLSRDECWSLLRRAQVVRLAVVVDGWPVVLPVNHVLDGDDLVIRTEPGTKLSAIRRAGRVAVQADDTDPLYRSGWSVLVRGNAEEVTDAAELARLSSLGLQPWVAGEPRSWVRIHPVGIAGRRLARAWRYPEPPP